MEPVVALVICVALVGIILIPAIINALFGATQRAIEHSVARQGLNEVLTLNNSSTWRLESIDQAVRADGVFTSDPPQVITVVADKIARLSFDKKAPFDSVFPVSENGILSAMHTPNFRSEGRITDMQFGVGQLRWDDIEEGGSEVVWVKWQWERLPDNERDKRIRNVVIAVMPGIDNGHIQTFWGIFEREERPSVNGVSTFFVVEKSATRATYRAVLSVEDELHRL